MKRIAAVITALAITPMAYAGTYSDLKQKDENFTVRWTEQKGVIQNDSVCDSYEKGSVIYRNCRREAQIKFRDGCAKARDKGSKFCVAKDTYAP